MRWSGPCRRPPASASPRSRQVIAAADDVAAQLGRALGNIVIDFDQTNPFVVNALRNNQLRLIQGITSTQRQAVQEALRIAASNGAGPREIARAFRQSIGLTPYQVRAVASFEAELRALDRRALTKLLRDRRFDPTIVRAIRDGQPLSDAQIQRMVGRYRDRYVKFRAETIARTEALRSVHEGNHAMFRQALEEGIVNQDQLMQEWNTALDERVRGSHVLMHGQQQPVNTPFVSGNGNLLLYPGDPSAPPEDTIQCRCSVGTRVTALSGATSITAEIG